MATVFASNNKKSTEGFGPKVDGFDHFEFGDHKSLKKKITKNTAAIMVETIMGEGGIKVIPDYCLRGLRKLCNEKNILLILDEVQSGLGRTGKLFAYQHEDIIPDGLILGKALGGGLMPVSAFLSSREVMDHFDPGSHGSTFGGNPLAMSVGNAVLDQILKKSFLKNVQIISKYFHDELSKLQSEFPSIIKEVRGLGLLTGIKVTPDQNLFVKKLQENKLLTIRAAENVVRVLPPLNGKKRKY